MAEATLRKSQPVSVVGPDSPNPGMLGMMTWNVPDGSPPCACGSVRGPTTWANSTIEPGRPCVMTRGVASATGERTWAKCRRAPSTVVTNCGQSFSPASVARQSYSCRQYRANSRR